MTDITLEQRAANALINARSQIGASRPDDADDAAWWDELTELAEALRLSAGTEVDWRAQYRLQTAMRYMDNAPRLTLSEAYKMADHDVRGLELAAAPRHEPGEVENG